MRHEHDSSLAPNGWDYLYWALRGLQAVLLVIAIWMCYQLWPNATLVVLRLLIYMLLSASDS
jgi:hypothetical protein